MRAGRLPAFALSALLALIPTFLSTAAEAGVGGGAGGVGSAVRRASLVRPAQYYQFEGQNYCWYAQGWQGPGWYVCGEEWDSGVGWGGPGGWLGLGGAGRPWRSGRRGVGEWHRRPPPNALGARPAPWAGVGVVGAPHARHGGAPAYHSLPALGGRAPTLGLPHPASPGFGGGAGFHGFGGGAFSAGGRGGHVR